MLMVNQFIGFGVATQTVPFTTGTFGNASTGAGGRSVSAQSAGLKFVAPSTAVLSTIKINVQAVSASNDFLIKLYTDNAGSPGTQVGSDGSSLTISTTGDKTFTCAGDQSVIGGATYWIVVALTSGLGLDVDTCANDASYASGRHATITSITDNLPSFEDWRMEIIAV